MTQFNVLHYGHALHDQRPLSAVAAVECNKTEANWLQSSPGLQMTAVFCTVINPLLPAASRWGLPPGRVIRKRRVVSWASIIALKIPLSCYRRVVCLQGVALASHTSSTHRTPASSFAKLVNAVVWFCNPFMRLTSRALVAQPMNPLLALQCGVAGQDALSCIALMVPL